MFNFLKSFLKWFINKNKKEKKNILQWFKDEKKKIFFQVLRTKSEIFSIV